MMPDELKILLATVAGEAIGCSPAAWKAIASVILNRVSYREWAKRKSVLEVIAFTGFDAFAHSTPEYRKALWHFDGVRSLSPGQRLILDALAHAIKPIYFGTEPRTTDAVLYFSPKAQAQLHKQNPKVWPERPRWNFDLLEMVKVPGTECDDLQFYRYGKVIAL